MECDKFESLLIDELYEELDEVTSAAVKRHAAGCARCSGLLSGFRATRKVASLPLEEPSSDLEDRILSAVREQQKVLPMRARFSSVLARAGAWAMRPQTAMAAVLVLVIGTSLVMVQNRKAMSPMADMRTSNGEGMPVHAAAQPMATAAASAYALDRQDTDFAHGVVDRERGLGPARTATLSSALEEQEKDKNAPVPAQTAADDLKKEALNASAVGGVPTTRAEAKVADEKLADNGFAQHATATSGMTGGAGGQGQAAQQTAPVAQASQLDCSAAGIQKYEQARDQSKGTPAGNQATLDVGRCYRASGDTQKARARFSELLPIQGYAQVAQTELDQMTPVTAVRRAATQPAPTQAPAAIKPAAKADSY